MCDCIGDVNVVYIEVGIISLDGREGGCLVGQEGCGVECLGLCMGVVCVFGIHA